MKSLLKRMKKEKQPNIKPREAVDRDYFPEKPLFVRFGEY